MTRSRFFTAVTAAVLALTAAGGAVGCLITAFDLPVQQPVQMAAGLALAAALCALVLSLRRGGAVMLCLLAFGGGYVYREGSAAVQFGHLLHRLTSVYNRAYGWGIYPLPESADAACYDWPLFLLGLLIVLSLCESVCRRRGAPVPFLTVLVPLGACVVVTDTVPAAPCLMAVFMAMGLLILTSSVRRENPEHGLRLTLAAALPVILAVLTLFRLVPEESYVNHSQLHRENILLAAQKLPQLVETGTTRLAHTIQNPIRSPHVDLSALGERISFTYPVLEVTSCQTGACFLREQAFDRYDGRSWQASEDTAGTFAVPAETAGTLTLRTVSVRDSLILPYYPAEAVALTGGAAPNTEALQEYSFSLAALPENWRQIACQPGGEDPDTLPDLPDLTRLGALAYLTDRFPADASNTEKADSIAALVTDSAVYDTDPSRMPEGEADFALWFLREGERGYCVHFATAATVLLRAAGVPARYVTGWLVETRAGETVTVTEENAHAWAEYYEPNLGVWLPLEATPATEAPPVTPAVTAPAQTAPTQAPTGEPAPATRLPEPTASREEPAPAEPEQKALPLWPLWALALAAALPLQRLLRLKLRQRFFCSGSPNRQALMRWRETERLSRILKETPPVWLQELALKAKFSQYTLTDQELAAFDAHINSCVGRMRRSPLWMQLMYRLVYAVY